jgi:hypothetical protein
VVEMKKIIEPHMGTFKFLESVFVLFPASSISRNYNKEQNGVIKKFLNGG